MCHCSSKSVNKSLGERRGQGDDPEKMQSYVSSIVIQSIVRCMYKYRFLSMFHHFDKLVHIPLQEKTLFCNIDLHEKYLSKLFSL